MRKLSKTLTMLILGLCAILGTLIGGLNLLNFNAAIDHPKYNPIDAKWGEEINGSIKIGDSNFYSRVSYYINNAGIYTEITPNRSYYSTYMSNPVNNGDFVFFDDVKTAYVNADYSSISDTRYGVHTIEVTVEHRITLSIDSTYNLTISGQHGTTVLNQMIVANGYPSLTAVTDTTNSLDSFSQHFGAEGWYNFMFTFRYRTHDNIVSPIYNHPWNFYIVKSADYFTDGIRPTFTNDPDHPYLNNSDGSTSYFYNYGGDGSSSQKQYPELSYNTQKFDVRMQVQNYMDTPLYDSGVRPDGSYYTPNYSVSNTTVSGQSRTIQVWEIGVYSFTSQMYYLCEWNGARVPIKNYTEHTYNLYIFGYQLFYNDYQTNQTTWFGGRNNTDSDVTLFFNQNRGTEDVKATGDGNYIPSTISGGQIYGVNMPAGATPVVTNMAPVFPQYLGTLSTQTSYYKYRSLNSTEGDYKTFLYTERTPWFSQAGYYQFFVNYTYKVNGSVKDFYQVFYFKINNSSPDVDLKLDGVSTNLINNLNPTNQQIVTNKNVSLTWENAGIYEKQPRIDFATLPLGSTIDFSKPVFYSYTKGNEFTTSNIYIFRISHGLLNELPRYIAVILDKEAISGANAINIVPDGSENPVQNGTTKLSNGTNTFSYFGGGEIQIRPGEYESITTHLEWNKKTSGAWFDEQKTQYRYTPLEATQAWDNSHSIAQFTTSYKLTQNTTDWRTYNFSWNTQRNKWVGEKFTVDGLYEFRIVDLAGNVQTYHFFIDSISPVIYQSEESINKVFNIVNKETEIRWGTHKVIQVDPSNTLRSIFGPIYNATQGGIIVPLSFPVIHTYEITEGENKGEIANDPIYSQNYILKALARLQGEHQFKVVDTLGNLSLHLIELNFDASQGIIYANDQTAFKNPVGDVLSQVSRVKTQTLAPVDPLFYSETSNLTRRGYIRFDFMQRTAFPVETVSYKYYALEYNDGKASYSTTDSAPNGGVLYDMYTTDETYDDFTNTVQERPFLCDVINPSPVNPNKTQPGIYVILREYQNDPDSLAGNIDEEGNSLDTKIRDYIFIVDRNGTVTTVFDNDTHLIIGQGSNQMTFKNFNRRDDNGELDHTTQVFLATNKLPIVVKVPLSKYNLSSQVSRGGRTIQTRALNLLILLEYKKNDSNTFYTVAKNRNWSADGQGNLIIPNNLFFQEGIYRLTIEDGSYTKTIGGNEIFPNVSQILFEVRNNSPKGDYFTKADDVVNYTIKNMIGDTQTSVQISGSQKLMFTFEDPASEYLAKIDPSKTKITQTSPASMTGTQLNANSIMTRYIAIDNTWEVYNSFEHGSIQNPRYRYEYNLPTRNLQGNLVEFLYQINIAYIGEPGHYTYTINQGTPEEKVIDYYSDTILLKIDNTAPSHNLTRVKAADSYHTNEALQSYAFAINTEFVFTPATVVYSVNGVNTKNYYVHDTYRIFYRNIQTMADAIDILGSGINTTLFNEFTNEYYETRNNFTDPWILKPAANIRPFAEIANHGVGFNKYYQIVEQDEAGNFTTYIIQLNTLNREQYPTLYYSGISANGPVNNGLISTTTIQSAPELNIRDFQFTSLGNLVVNNTHFSVTINGVVYKYTPTQTPEQFLALINARVAAQNTLYNISINHRFGILSFIVNTPSADYLPLTHRKIGTDICVEIVTQLNATKLTSLKIEIVENGFRYTVSRDKNDTVIWQSLVQNPYYPSNTLVYYLEDGEYIVTTVDNFGRTNTIQIHGSYEDRAELIFTGPTQKLVDEPYLYTGRQVRFVYQSFIYSNLTVYRKDVGDKNFTVYPSFTYDYGEPGSGLQEYTITPYAGEMATYRIEIRNSLGAISSFSFNFYCNLPKFTLRNDIGDDITKKIEGNQTNASVYLYFNVGQTLFNPTVNITRTYTVNGQVRTENMTRIQNGDFINNEFRYGTYSISVMNSLTATSASYIFEYVENPVTDFGIYMLNDDGTPNTNKKVSPSPLLRSIWITSAGVIGLVNNGGERINVNEYFTNQTFTSSLQQVSNMIKFDQDKDYTLTETKISGEEIYVYCLAGSPQFGPSQKIYFVITRIPVTGSLRNNAATTITINGEAISSNSLFRIVYGTGYGGNPLTTISWPAYNGTSSSFSGNAVYVEYYYNGIFGGISFGTLSPDGNRRTLEISSHDTGEFLIMFKDMAGNNQVFTDTTGAGRTMTYYSIYQVASAPVLINGKTPVNNMTYNGVHLTVQNFALLNTVSYYLKGIRITRNGVVQVDHGYESNSTRPQNIYDLSAVGNYTVELEYNSFNTRVLSTLTFNVVNPQIHLLGYNFTPTDNCIVTKVVRDGAVLHNDPTGALNKTEVFLNRESGNGVYNIEIVHISTSLRPNETYAFDVRINTNIPEDALRSTTPFGTDTVSTITVFYNPAQLYNLYGTMTLQIKLSTNRGSSSTEFRITSGAYNAEIPFQITSSGTYTFKLVTDDGRILYSEVIVKNTPLNFAAILLIALAAVAGLTGIIFFIRLRTRMAVK